YFLYLVQVHAVRRAMDEVCHVVKRAGQRMDVLTIKGGDKILAELQVDLVGDVVASVFVILDLAKQLLALRQVIGIDCFTQYLGHFDQVIADLLKKGEEFLILRNKILKYAVER